jgi:ferredoxin-nitrite reductase
MDNVRNITGNPLAGIDPHELIDTRPLCRSTDDMITGDRLGNPELSNLPRKFNIAFNATRDDFVHTHINDLAFDAVTDPATGNIGFNVVVGGYLSLKRCEISFPLDVFVPEEEVLDFTRAMLVVSARHVFLRLVPFQCFLIE